MGFRFYKSFKIGKSIRLNISKTGPSLSFGKGRVKHNVSKRGLQTSIRLLKGLSWRKKW